MLRAPVGRVQIMSKSLLMYVPAQAVLGRHPSRHLLRYEAMVPRHLELERNRGLRIEWSDGRTSYLPVALLRKMSPSAETKKLREEMAISILFLSGKYTVVAPI